MIHLIAKNLLNIHKQTTKEALRQPDGDGSVDGRQDQNRAYADRLLRKCISAPPKALEVRLCLDQLYASVAEPK